MPPLFPIDTAAAVERMVTKGMAKDHARIVVDTINEASSDYVTSDEFRLLTSQVESLESKLNERFDKIGDGFARGDESAERTSGKFVEQDSKFSLIDARFDKIDAELSELRALIERKLAEQTKHLTIFMSGLIGIAVAIVVSVDIFI